MTETKKILLVEDTETLMECLAMQIAYKGYDVIPFKDGIDCLNYFLKTEGKEESIALITDLEMPYRTGIDVIAHARLGFDYKKPILLHSGRYMTQREEQRLEGLEYKFGIKGEVSYLNEFLDTL